MSKKNYTLEQIQDLKSNRFVKNCTEKSIQFTDECKIIVMQQVGKWIWSKEIFRDLWFPDYVINSNIPKRFVERQRKKLRKEGNKEWRKDERGKHSTWRKRKNTNDDTKDDKQVMISEKKLKRILAENDVYKELLFKDKDKYP